MAKPRSPLSTAILLVASLAVSALLLVAGLWLYDRTAPLGGTDTPDPLEAPDIASPDGSPSVHLVCEDCPYFYRLNPAHPEISSQGLRDREYQIPKPDGVRRVLVLGDSVALGAGLPGEDSFPKRLERWLDRGDRRTEVVNASVSAYTAYNELQFYLAEGRAFEPDTVVVAFVMNDVVNPRIHWAYNRTPIQTVSEDAIPDPDHDRTYVRPALESKLALRLRLRAVSRINGRGWRDAEGRTWPVYVTGEDTLSIESLTDWESPEWRWLRSVYDELFAAVRADGAEPVLLVLPLAYQLDADYPFLPQTLFARYCEERGVPCVDVLPAFRERAARPLFLGTRHGGDDIWHLSEEGHDVVARELARFLESDS